MRLRRIIPASLLFALVFSLQSAGAPPAENRSHREARLGGPVVICHCPPGRDGHNCRTREIGAPAVQAHLAHGDTLGPCDVPGRETACCLPDGCQDEILPGACHRMGGAPFGLCAACADVTCPNAGCIGATGACNQEHGTPGCDSLACCDQICRNRPSCCEVAWDAQCAQTRCSISGDESACCSPAGSCGVGSSSICSGSGGEHVGACSGDEDGDHVDDACVCQQP